MVMCKVRYEEIREQRMEENKKRMEQLHLPLLSHALKIASSPKPSPMKKTTPRIAKTELVPVRRSLRFTSTSAKDEITTATTITYERIKLPRRVTNRELSKKMIYASDEERECSIKKAEELETSLGSEHPSFVRTMLPSHVSGGFWLGLSMYNCKRMLPKTDAVITLIDEKDEEWPVIYLAKKTGLSGGWKKFSIDHQLVDGDALVFQLIRPTVFKVFIVRVNSNSITSDNTDNKLEGGLID